MNDIKSSEIQLNLEEVCAKVRPSLAAKIRYSVNLLQKAEKMALRLDPKNGFYLAFSGGKDSQTLYHITKLAGVRFKAHMNLTSIDPPEVIRFVKMQYPDVELIKPRMSIFDMAKKKRFLPTRKFRWCCAEYKEVSGVWKVTLIGIRHEESSKRAQRKEFSIRKKEYENFDQWSEHEEKMVTCVGGKDKILLSPIIHWTHNDVWEFLNVNRIPHCELYDEGYTRIGCICCPMSQAQQKAKEIKRWPHVKRNWIKTIQWLIDNGYINHNFTEPETVFRWWISGKNFKSFYSDEFLQQKINFEEESKVPKGVKI